MEVTAIFRSSFGPSDLAQLIDRVRDFNYFPLPFWRRLHRTYTCRTVELTTYAIAASAAITKNSLYQETAAYVDRINQPLIATERPCRVCALIADHLSPMTDSDRTLRVAFKLLNHYACALPPSTWAIVKLMSLLVGIVGKTRAIRRGGDSGGDDDSPNTKRPRIDQNPLAPSAMPPTWAIRTVDLIDDINRERNADDPVDEPYTALLGLEETFYHYFLASCGVRAQTAVPSAASALAQRTARTGAGQPTPAALIGTSCRRRKAIDVAGKRKQMIGLYGYAKIAWNFDVFNIQVPAITNSLGPKLTTFLRAQIHRSAQTSEAAVCYCTSGIVPTNCAALAAAAKQLFGDDDVAPAAPQDIGSGYADVQQQQQQQQQQQAAKTAPRGGTRYEIPAHGTDDLQPIFKLEPSSDEESASAAAAVGAPARAAPTVRPLIDELPGQPTVEVSSTGGVTEAAAGERFADQTFFLRAAAADLVTPTMTGRMLNVLELHRPLFIEPDCVFCAYTFAVRFMHRTRIDRETKDIVSFFADYFQRSDLADACDVLAAIDVARALYCNSFKRPLPASVTGPVLLHHFYRSEFNMCGVANHILDTTEFYERLGEIDGDAAVGGNLDVSAADRQTSMFAAVDAYLDSSVVRSKTCVAVLLALLMTKLFNHGNHDPLIQLTVLQRSAGTIDRFIALLKQHNAEDDGTRDFFE